MPARHRLVDIAGLIFLIALCLGIGALGGWVTAGSVKTWYQTLNKPSFNPPDWIFGPVWTTLYILMAIAAWRVWRRADKDTARGPLALFALQLAVNLGWSAAFFGLQRIGAALVVVVVLELMIVAMLLAFRRIDRMAGLLLVPYALWVAFATVLNTALWRLN